MLIVAVILAKAVEKILRAVLVRLRFDAFLERAGFDVALQRIGVRQSLNLVIPRFVYFLLLLLFLQTGAESLALIAIADAIRSFLTYLPNVIAAILVLLVGTTAGRYAGSATADAARNSGIEYAAPLGKAVAALIFFVAGVMALAQLKINVDIIRIVTFCCLSGIALAFGLSVGLGTRDITRNLAAGFYARRVYRPGQDIEIRGHRGILKGITPVQAVIEVREQTVTVSNAAFLDEVVKQ
jgi:small-conductance mechanosensitive channel